MKKVLMISTDRKILDAGSAVAARMREYADVFGELHILVFSTESAGRVALSERCFVYPTGSRSKYMYVFDAARIGKEIIASNSEWVVTVQDPFETGIVGLLLARRIGAKLDVQVHTDFLSPYFSQGSTLNRLRKFVARYVIPRASSVRTVSLRIRASLEQGGYFGKDAAISVMPIYTESAPVSATQIDRFPQFDKVVLMVSRLEPEKDIRTALEAFSIAIKSSPKSGLVIVGSGSDEAGLAHVAAHLEIGNNVVFLGWRDAADLAVIRASSDVFLASSLYEGYGLSLIEAARAGLPLVSTDVGIAPDILPREVLAKPHDVDGLARLLAEALHHPLRFMASAEGVARVTYPSRAEYLARLKASLLL